MMIPVGQLLNWFSARLAIAALLCLLVTAQPAEAINITVTPSSGSDADLAGAMNVAAQVWEHHILDDHNVTVYFLWDDTLDANIAAQTNSFTVGQDPDPAPERPVQATIRFNPDLGWFNDPTPADNSEFGSLQTSEQDLGGGAMNTGRYMTGGPAGLDLVTIAMHEMAHALGFDATIDGFIDDAGDGDIDLTAPRPYVGAELPLSSGAHLNLPNALLRSSALAATRMFPTHADVLAVAESAKYTDLNLGPVPEPASLAMFALVAVALRHRRSVR